MHLMYEKLACMLCGAPCAEQLLVCRQECGMACDVQHAPRGAAHSIVWLSYRMRSGKQTLWLQAFKTCSDSRVLGT
jgi:hypothetical protein